MFWRALKRQVLRLIPWSIMKGFLWCTPFPVPLVCPLDITRPSSHHSIQHTHTYRESEAKANISDCEHQEKDIWKKKKKKTTVGAAPRCLLETKIKPTMVSFIFSSGVSTQALTHIALTSLQSYLSKRINVARNKRCRYTLLTWIIIRKSPHLLTITPTCPSAPRWWEGRWWRAKH